MANTIRKCNKRMAHDGMVGCSNIRLFHFNSYINILINCFVIKITQFSSFLNDFVLRWHRLFLRRYQNEQNISKSTDHNTLTSLFEPLRVLDQQRYVAILSISLRTPAPSPTHSGVQLVWAKREKQGAKKNRKLEKRDDRKRKNFRFH